MTFKIRNIPILTGFVAESFIQNVEEREKHPRHLKLKVSFAQIDEMEARKHSYLKEHNGKNPFSVWTCEKIAQVQKHHSAYSRW